MANHGSSRVKCEHELIVNTSGTVVVEYTYDAWGRLLTTTGSMASTLGEINPLRYRGYVYDTETGLYYLQSRYYNPAMGRFINADVFVSTGQGILGCNMFAYCRNNSVNRFDSDGKTDESALEEAKQELEKLLEQYTTITENGFSISIEDETASWNECITKIGDKEAYSIMSQYLCGKYEEKYEAPFLFTEECVAYEIEYHVDAYMCASGYSGYSRNITTYIFSKARLILHCRTIDISISDCSDWRQATMFGYKNGIREQYQNTDLDPYKGRRTFREYIKSFFER